MTKTKNQAYKRFNGLRPKNLYGFFGRKTKQESFTTKVY